MDFNDEIYRNPEIKRTLDAMQGQIAQAAIPKSSPDPTGLYQPGETEALRGMGRSTVGAIKNIGSTLGNWGEQAIRYTGQPAEMGGIPTALPPAPARMTALPSSTGFAIPNSTVPSGAIPRYRADMPNLPPDSMPAIGMPAKPPQLAPAGAAIPGGPAALEAPRREEWLQQVGYRGQPSANTFSVKDEQGNVIRTGALPGRPEFVEGGGRNRHEQLFDMAVEALRNPGVDTGIMSQKTALGILAEYRQLRGQPSEIGLRESQALQAGKQAEKPDVYQVAPGHGLFERQPGALGSTTQIAAIPGVEKEVKPTLDEQTAKSMDVERYKELLKTTNDPLTNPEDRIKAAQEAAELRSKVEGGGRPSRQMIETQILKKFPGLNLSDPARFKALVEYSAKQLSR